MKVLLLSFLLCLFPLKYLSAEFPSYIERCKFGDDACILKRINMIFRTRNKGDKGLNLISLDPLRINAIDIKQGSESPVNIDLKFRNCSMFGLSESEVYKVKGFSKDLKGPHEIYGKTPVVTLIGDYRVNGRVLILPIVGNGMSNITLKNIDMVIRFNGEPFEKNGKTHMKIGKISLDVKISRLYTNFENLFNGDQVLSDTMNAFLNENWKDIWDEIKVSVLKAYQLIFKSVINNTFDKFPYDELFVE